MSESIRVTGIKELINKLDNPTWVHRPARRFLSKWGSTVERGAKSRIKRGPGGWLDTGASRQSLTHEVDSSTFPVYARAGSNKKEVRWGEYGTGLLSEDPESSKRRYFPPPAALDNWAIKHGFHVGSKDSARADVAASPGTYGYLVARMIWLKGGTEPRRFLRDSTKEATTKIPGWLTEFAAEIEAAASAGSA